MSDIMKQIPFGKIMDRVLTEKEKYNTIYSVNGIYTNKQDKTLKLFKNELENPVGPAAGPHTQLAQNLVASYVAGGRFFELKTVQILDGHDLHVDKPCIRADDECYNVEWSTELYVEQALEEYVKGWFACKLVAKEFNLGDPDAIIFNMSVGYNLEGIKSSKIDGFIEGMKDARNTPYYRECKRWALENLDRFNNVDEDFINSITGEIVNSITLSTMHGCPADEIEKIVSYLMEVKGINTYLKCNPTLLGYDFVRELLDDMGYDYMVFKQENFDHDLKFDDAVKMIKRLQDLAVKNNVDFGVKLSNTFQVSSSRNELPGDDMYMSGKALYPLTINVAYKLSEAFNGMLPMSFSGGADINNISDIFEAGIWPITVATILLKPTGYNRLKALAEKLDSCEFNSDRKTDTAKLKALAQDVRTNAHYKKAAAVRAKVDNLVSFDDHKKVAIDCRVVCGSCVNVCPNRANITTIVDDKKVLMHIDDYCNECGNCYIFCPDPCTPYKDRFTLFSSSEDLKNSSNQGFAILDNNMVAYRLDGKEETCDISKAPKIVVSFIASVKENHPYLI
ncbi:MAG: 4Fe-4S dicluster domain-containing protein [Anaerorhabdus sp.]